MAAKKTVHEIDAARAALVLEWQAINERIQPDLDRVAAIKAELEQLPVLKYAVPGTSLAVDVSQGKSFKPDLFVAKYPITARPDLYRAVPDPARIKELLAPADVEDCYQANKVSVKLV